MVDFEQINSTTFRISHFTANGHNRRTIIGDKDHAAFHPMIEVQPFEGDGDYLKIEYVSQVPFVSSDLSENANLKWADTSGEFAFSPLMEKLHSRFYDDIVHRRNGKGLTGVKCQILLNVKPTVDPDGLVRFIFKISGHKDMRFLYQPALTAQEIAEGCNQPECVIDSYAIYHNSKVNNRYTTGKIGHLYRPWCEDSEGNFTWGHWEIDESLGVITKCIPEEAFDYVGSIWWIVDFTFGDTDGGASTATLENNKAGNPNLTPSDGNGNGDSISADIVNDTAAKDVICGLYLNADASLVLNGCTNAETVDATYDDYWTFEFGTAPSIVGTTAYDLMARGEAGGGGMSIYRDTDVGNGMGVAFDIYAAVCPGPHGMGSSNARHTIYCTYSAAGETVTLTKLALAFSGKSLSLNRAQIISKVALAYTGKSIVPDSATLISKVALAFTGKGVTFASITSIVKVVLTFTGKVIFTNYIFIITKVALAWTGKALSIVVGAIVSITKVALTFTGKSVFVNMAYTIVKVALAWTGKSVSIVQGTILTITKVVLTYTGKVLFLNFAPTIVKVALLFGGKSVAASISGLADRGLSKLGMSTKLE